MLNKTIKNFSKISKISNNLGIKFDSSLYSATGKSTAFIFRFLDGLGVVPGSGPGSFVVGPLPVRLLVRIFSGLTLSAILLTAVSAFSG